MKVKVNNNQYCTAINKHPSGAQPRLWPSYGATGMHSPPDSVPSCVNCGVTSYELWYLVTEEYSYYNVSIHSLSYIDSHIKEYTWLPR